jgi:AcrR family transcriptional regulator
MTDDHRHRILQAAARVYAQHGWRGSTTKRIAEEAGVNEVTLFRHFGAKDTLLEQMMLHLTEPKEGMTLPAVPRDPAAELEGWVRAHHTEMCARRPFIRQLVSDLQEHPDLHSCATNGPNSATSQLRSYVERLHTMGFVEHHDSTSAADQSASVTMLMGAVFADSMNRDLMPEMFPQPVDVSLRSYVRFFLRGLGVSLRLAAVASSDRDHASSVPPSPVGSE